MKYRDLSQESLSGILCHWTFHNVSDVIEKSNDLKAQLDERQLLPILVTAEVIQDNKGRWRAGETMRSTYLTAFDIQSMRVKTQNSVYQLQGNGVMALGVPRGIEECVGNAILALKFYETGHVNFINDAIKSQEKP